MNKKETIFYQINRKENTIKFWGETFGQVEVEMTTFISDYINDNMDEVDDEVGEVNGEVCQGLLDLVVEEFESYPKPEEIFSHMNKNSLFPSLEN